MIDLVHVGIGGFIIMLLTLLFFIARESRINKFIITLLRIITNAISIFVFGQPFIEKNEEEDTDKKN
ncbi:hypothetical protein [Anaerosphaera multitolerans]|uniref:Uncharacterized protein n=1 Tax=Anaerosphaera multitolerans TaxID=2487351 RepID=A0A437S448_9FIRM|nr:hypothetical protein [Anaerosphaera multitolerans]RVU53794.1 hypothetical protein EF514_10720 [Anaerosphaera multitolerans]